ncbi:MAG: bifunctional hydroxymethylpyrimidine kinase/phosphomethylpyrimidine kinase [Myxococcota bacterium]
MSTSTRDRVPIALTIAGSDSGGGAGIQADLKTFHDHGVYGTSAITAVTAQNTQGVLRVDPVPVDGLVAQLEAVFDDFSVHAVKIGMLGNAAHARAVVEFLTRRADLPPIVVDPVMVSTSGTRLLAPDAIQVVRDELLPLATLATPNLDEGAVLANVPLDRDAIEAWATQAPCPVLLTGGDEHKPQVVDVLVDGPAIRRWKRARREGPGFHGTGCTLSSAIAARLARGDDLETAIDRALGYVQGLLNAALQWRPGSGQHVLPHGLVASPLSDRPPLGAPWSLL